MEMRVFAREGERRMFLEIKDISKKIGEDYVLREINLSMDKGRSQGLSDTGNRSGERREG